MGSISFGILLKLGLWFFNESPSQLLLLPPWQYCCSENVVCIMSAAYIQMHSRLCLGQIKNVFRVTRPYLNLLVKPRIFSGFLEKI